MKTKLRTMLLAAAGVLGSVAVAHAQPAPDPAPAPAPAAVDPSAPAPVPPPVPTSSWPVPPAAPAPVAWSAAAPQPDAAQEPPKKPNPFSFTRLTWNNQASTKIFGVSRDYYGTEDEVYTMDFGLSIRYSFINTPKSKLYVTAATGVEVELTNSDTSTKLREPLLRDTLLGLGGTRVLFQSGDKETQTSALLSGGASLPTSRLSRYQGKHLGTSITAGLIHQQKLAGSSADWFPNVLFFGTVNWGHTFSRAYTPTSTDLAVTNRPRQVACDAAGCLTDQSDQLSGYSLTHDTVRFGGTYYLSIYKDILSFGNSWEIAERYKYAFADTCVNLPTTPGCEPAGRLADATNRGALTTFDVSISYAIPENLGRVDLGYVNTANQIGYDGQRQSVFYSPDAQFYMNVVAFLDGIYDRAASKKDVVPRQRVGLLPRFRAN